MRARGAGARAARGLFAALVAALLLAACELEETSLVAPEDVLVAEAYVIAEADSTIAVVYLHRTLGAGPPPDPAATRVSIVSDVGGALAFAPAPDSFCVVESEALPEGPGTCFRGTRAPGTPVIGPGERVRLEVVSDRGETLTGAAVLPGDFDLSGDIPAGACALEPDTQVTLRWSTSEGTWAYFAETKIHGLLEALGPDVVDEREDPLFLLGLAISAEDNEIRFPAEFGVFDRFDLDRRIATALQRGLPARTWADVAIAAGDRNVVNWVRGGDFNPSGLIRVPSVFGDGTGVLGAWVSRRLRIEVATDAAEDLPPCPAG